MILAGDVGGTKVNLALCEVKGSRISTRFLLRYPSADFESLRELLVQYLADAAAEAGTDLATLKKSIHALSFGVPGPVIDGKCQTANLPWIIDARLIEAELGLGPVHLINDLEAMAYGLLTLSEGQGLRTLRPGKQVQANQALIAPGTGLGEALIVWHDGDHLISASEGGHCDFAPQSEEQVELLRWMWQRHSHVSWEHLAAGPGIYRIYRFLKESGREKPDDAVERQLLQDGDPSPVITSQAIRGSSPICTHAIDLWLFFVGAEAGNLALKTLCRGGLFLGGGIAPKIIELFARPSFSAGFEGKGRMSGIVKEIPIYAVVDAYAGLYGAALQAKA